MYKRCFIFTIVVMSCFLLRAQKVASDTTINYYESVKEAWGLKLYTAYRHNAMEIRHDNSSLKLLPNSPMTLGVGVSYKGAGVWLGVGLPHTDERIRKLGKTSRLDIQGSVSLKRLSGEAYLRYYQGYYNSNPDDFVTWDKDYYPQLPDLKTLSLGFSALYILNHHKFSNKAAYSRTQIQKRSSGSILLGIFINYDASESENGFFPSEFPDSISSGLDISAYQYFATGLSFGYTYTWVISKSFFVNGTVNPGLGYKDIRIKNSEGIQDIKRNANLQLAMKASIGYENKFLFAGLTASTLIRNMNTNNYNIDMATEQFRLYIGKRF